MSDKAQGEAVSEQKQEHEHVVGQDEPIFATPPTHSDESFGEKSPEMGGTGATESVVMPGQHQDEANTLLIAELRRTVNDLSAQSDGLNTKLVASLERISDLEDALAQAQDQASSHKAKIDALQTETKAHQTLVNQGLLIEKEHVQTEMQKLMEKVMEESRQRGQAEQNYMQYKSEVDDLSASLFDEANKMVALEKQARAAADLKSNQFADRLRDTEGLIADQQAQMQALKELLDHAEDENERLKAHSQELENMVVDASQSFDGEVPHDERVQRLRTHTAEQFRPPSRSESPAPLTETSDDPLNRPLPALLSDHPPYDEYVAFVRYLRRLKVMNQNSAPGSTDRRPSGSGTLSTSLSEPPTAPMSSHLSQPFLKRCVEEDSDTTLRLDLAPGLSWLSRRQVNTALVDGSLVIEPIQDPRIPFTTCTLCGRKLSSSTSKVAEGPRPKWMTTLNAGLGSFSRSSSSSGGPPSYSNALPPHPAYDPSRPVVHVFRISESANQRYALCTEYCLARLRTSAEFWNYLRMIERSLSTDNFKLSASQAPHRSTTDLQAHSYLRKASAENGMVTIDGVGVAVLDATSASPASLSYTPHAISDRSMSEGNGPPLPIRTSSITPDEAVIVNRSWPVIVKLKEKMFWVRIGLAVGQSSQSTESLQPSLGPPLQLQGQVTGPDQSLVKTAAYGHGRSGSGELSIPPRRPTGISVSASSAIYGSGSAPMANSAPDLSMDMPYTSAHLTVPPSPLGHMSSVATEAYSSSETVNVIDHRAERERAISASPNGDNFDNVSLQRSPDRSNEARSVGLEESPSLLPHTVQAKALRSTLPRKIPPPLPRPDSAPPASASVRPTAPAAPMIDATAAEEDHVMATVVDRPATPPLPTKSRARRTAPVPPNESSSPAPDKDARQASTASIASSTDSSTLEMADAMESVHLE